MTRFKDTSHDAALVENDATTSGRTAELQTGWSGSAAAAVPAAPAAAPTAAQQGGASSVEVYGFVGWITSAVAFGEGWVGGGGFVERGHRLAALVSLEPTPCGRADALRAAIVKHPSLPHPMVPAAPNAHSALSAVGGGPGVAAAAPRHHILPVQVSQPPCFQSASTTGQAFDSQKPSPLD
jgi:hypothetical protein